MKNRRSQKILRIRFALSAALVCLLALGAFYADFANGGFTAGAQKKRLPPRRAPRVPTPRAARYSAFPHSAHKLKCDSCHKFPSGNWKTVRKTDAFPDITEYPRHESCLSCHRQQFFKGARPAICSICHTNPQPTGGPRHPFPNPREIFDQSPKGKTAAASDFQIFFPHDKHIDIVSQNEIPSPARGALFLTASSKRRASETSCAVCHQTYKPQGDGADEYAVKPPDKLGDAFWLKKGTFKTAPASHATCFTCHSADTGITPAPTDCATCHKLSAPEAKTDFDARVAAPMKIEDRMMMLAWRRRDSSATFRHEFSSHADMECATCHNAAAINTLDPSTKKVAIGSCNMCHITATTDDGGALNYEVDARKKDARFQCVKCHIAYGKLPVPASHTKAIEEAGE